MKLFRRIIFILSLLALAGGTVAAAVLPGPQQMICPTCHGLQKIAPGVYADRALSEADRRRAVRSLAVARKKVSRFYGTLLSSPRIIVCWTAECARIFGSEGAKGVAYAWHGILLTRSRIFDVIAAHEIAHIELHWRMGLGGWLAGNVPAWFDEGLAVVISQDPRFQRDADAKAVRDIMKVDSFMGAWSEHARRVGWRTAYGAASTRVRQLERHIGRDGLQRFVTRLIRNGDLPGLFAEARKGSRF